jgi:squalene-hopene cyclase-like protein
VAQVTVDSIGGRFRDGIAAKADEWSLVDTPETRALDVVNHVLRCVLQLDYLREYVDEFDALAALQHDDGGWSDLSSGTRSGIRNTCFSARNLIRANRILGRRDLAEAAERAVRLVSGAQEEDGSWADRVWGPRDATSSGMGLLLYALNEDFGAATAELRAAARACLERAARHLERTQETDGSWHDPSSYEAPVGPTAHLLPKLVLFEGRRTQAVGAGIGFLVESQEDDGSWDRRHVDHTCDAARALLLTASVLAERDLGSVAAAGIEWLVENVNDDGFWSERPGEESSLLLTCDVLDSFSKYEAHARSLDLRTFWE